MAGPSRVPARPEGRPSPRELLVRLEAYVGEAGAAELCADVLGAEHPTDHPDVVRFLGGAAGDSVLAGDSGWRPYWARVWGARGLLYVWDDAVTPVVLSRLGDESWRVAEMCMKVSARRQLPAADAATRLSTHELPRVRAVAMRLLGTSGDTEHVDAALAGLDDPAEEVRGAAARAVELMRRRLDLP